MKVSKKIFLESWNDEFKASIYNWDGRKPFNSYHITDFKILRYTEFSYVEISYSCPVGQTATYDNTDVLILQNNYYRNYDEYKSNPYPLKSSDFKVKLFSIEGNDVTDIYPDVKWIMTLTSYSKEK